MGFFWGLLEGFAWLFSDLARNRFSRTPGWAVPLVIIGVALATISAAAVMWIVGAAVFIAIKALLS